MTERKTARFGAVLLCLLMCGTLLTSCKLIHQTFSKKVDIVFDANGGVLAGKNVDDEIKGKKNGEIRCIVGDEIKGISAKRDYYDFTGWFSEKEDGIEVSTPSEEDTRLYAHWESANKNRNVEISDIKAAGNADGLVRISEKEAENEIDVTFHLSEYYGQKLAFTTKKGKVISEITVPGAGDESSFQPDGTDVAGKIPNKKWMNRKVTTYYIKSFGNDHVDETDPVPVRIKLAGQSKYFDKPIEGSMVWYGGAGEAPKDRSAAVLATDDTYVYAARDGKTYKWEKEFVMINLADVRTDIVYDIYNAYSSRFFPIKGKAMYMDNGKSGLKRYEALSKDQAMHENRKTGATTFMVPVQWDFAPVVAKAQERARKSGNTLYIVDSFRPMGSVDPVAKKVDDASLLAYGGTSAHNFGMAVDTGWQKVDKDGNPVGKPFVKNLQALRKKAAVKGPNGNRRESWWEGVGKLAQEWWHYGDTTLNTSYRDAAKRVATLYVNQKPCISDKRSRL